MERRLKLKSLKRVYSQKVAGSERRDVGLRSPGAPKKPLVKSLSVELRLNAPLSAPDLPAPGLHRIDELDLSSSQHLCRSATCPSVPSSLASPQPSPLPQHSAPESVKSSPDTCTLGARGHNVGTSLVRSHEDPGPITPGSEKRPHRGLRRTRSRPEGPAPSFGPRATGTTAPVESGGSLGATVGGTIKRYVSLLRSRSAVSHRERPVIGRISPDTSYEKACGSDRRGSAPATPVLGGRPNDASTPSRIVNFFSKRSFKNNPLKRTKSVTKLERSKRGGRGGMLEGDQDPLSLAYPVGARLRSSRSHESLLSSHNMMTTLDLSAGEVTIKPVHPSILGQEHCFQVTSPTSTRYFSCKTAHERDRWVDSLRRAINPNFDNTRRTERSLKIFIQEAKGVVVKKRYFCELLLDNVLFARTSSKQKDKMCFWGEQFDFSSLPPVETISVVLYREGEKKKKKKEKSVMVGTVNIPVAKVTNQTVKENWHQVQSKHKAPSKDSAALRILCDYQSVEVLPLELYADFLQYIKNNYGTLCEVLEPVIQVKSKEDIATALVHIMQHEGQAHTFLADLVMMEIQQMDDSHLLFRGNSLATKAMEAFMKLVGTKYLLDTLRQVITQVEEDGLDCEVDPMRVTQISSLQHQQDNLMSIVRKTWSRILNSHPYFPLELRECFCLCRDRLAKVGKESLSDKLISANIFLRFLCPAILSPSLFKFTQEYPDERTSRNLTLVAKTLQTLANFTKFQGKESYMEFMNEFIELEQAQMKTFLKQISSPLAHGPRMTEYDREIDVGRELSLLHTFLSEELMKLVAYTGKNAANKTHHLEKLRLLLDDISTAHTQPNLNLVQRLSIHGLPGAPPAPLTPQEGQLEDRSGFHSLQRNIFRYNDPTVADDYQVESGPGPATPVDAPSTPRPSTLPRSSYLVGSARTPAPDLTTADDYVLLTALSHEGPREPHPIAHSYSYNHLGPTPGPNSPAHRPQHHHHFHNHTAWYNTKQLSSGQQHQQQHPGEQLTNGAGEEGLELSPEDGDRHSAGETEANMKGSQTSISQLSNVASSGYQSFAYSQSSSPVDPSINQHEASGPGHGPSPHVTPPHLTAPLAFNNPMYHLNAGPSSPRPVAPHGPRPTHYHHHPQYHHHPHHPQPPQPQQSPVSSSLSSAHSVEDLTPHQHPSLPPPRGPQRTQSSSSEDSTSLACTPPLDHRAFKSGAPRTNPRCLPPSYNPSPILASPDLHHSSSDLVGATPGRRTKVGRRPAGEAGPGRRTRYNYDSDSSSDDHQDHPPARPRPQRHPHRTSETKTLEEYEQEILAVRSDMEEMHQKLFSAGEHMDVCGGAGEPTPLPLHHANNPLHPPLHLQHPRNGRQSPPYPAPPPVADPDPQGAHVRKLLHKLQEQFQKEQQKMKELMCEKDALIQAQEDRINDLDRTNTKLLMALEQIRELKLQVPGESPPGPQDGSNLSDTSDYKSSSC